MLKQKGLGDTAPTNSLPFSSHRRMKIWIDKPSNYSWRHLIKDLRGVICDLRVWPTGLDNDGGRGSLRMKSEERLQKFFMEWINDPA